MHLEEAPAVNVVSASVSVPGHDVDGKSRIAIICIQVVSRSMIDGVPD